MYNFRKYYAFLSLISKARICIGEFKVLIYDVFVLLSQTTSTVMHAFRQTDREHT